MIASAILKVASANADLQADSMLSETLLHHPAPRSPEKRSASGM
jgi:hypothetical protein